MSVYRSAQKWLCFCAQYNCMELLDPVTMGICPEISFDHASLSNKETRYVQKELVEIEKRFDEAREA